jgi:hypothetical protein
VTAETESVEQAAIALVEARLRSLRARRPEDRAEAREKLREGWERLRSAVRALADETYAREQKAARKGGDRS